MGLLVAALLGTALLMPLWLQVVAVVVLDKEEVAVVGVQVVSKLALALP
jgi:hypothetical protein